MSGRPVSVPVGSAVLEGDLRVPPAATGLVLFAHGSGSGRSSSRNRHVAEVLQRAGLATLLLDLLTVDEEQADRRTQQHRFDVPLLSDRLSGALHWAGAQPDLERLPVGLFGASTGAGAALLTAAEFPDLVGAVVSRGGRTDLAGGRLAGVRAPVLLLVGERDVQVLEVNRAAGEHLVSSELQVVPGASHLFEEAGALDRVAEASADFFRRHLAGGRTA